MKTTDITISSEDSPLITAGMKIQIINGLFPRYKNICFNKIVQVHGSYGAKNGIMYRQDETLTIRAASPPLLLKLKFYILDLISELRKYYQ